MSSSWALYPSLYALPEHCEPSSPFLAAISSLLHTCLPTPLGLLSTTLGTLSIISWLFAQVPQIYKNYKIQSTAGLSAWFLVEWCLGDSGNLIGSILTRQAGWQITIAAYYVLVDVVLVFQYYWYTYLKEWQFPRFAHVRSLDLDRDEGSWDAILPCDADACGRNDTIDPAAPLETKTSPAPTGDHSNRFRINSLASPDEKRNQPSRTIQRSVAGAAGALPLTSPRAVVMVTLLCAVISNAATLPATQPPPTNPYPSPHDSDARILAGRIASWTCTVMYLASRLPQILKNHRRKSTAGLSPLLFFAAFCGNCFYSSSLLTNPNAWNDYPAYGGGGWVGADGNDRWEWIARAVPFFLGAAGVLLLDATVGIQFMMYAEQHDELVVKVREHGKNKWRKVTGWMRGWVPSSPETDNAAVAAVVRAENQALLAAYQRDRYGAV
ncbi:hypothetical protein LOZ58_002748 [Ophidiomyces ophidiicola]|nr:hypothetical protein LOZ58_002748 [Ophidiomyces ophidiicola]